MATTRRLDARRIYDARLKANLSLDDVALALRSRGFKTTASAIWRWERGKNAPGAEVLASLADVLRTKLDDFYGTRDPEAAEDDEEADPAMRVRRLRAELVLAGRDDLALELAWLATVAGLNGALV